VRGDREREGENLEKAVSNPLVNDKLPESVSLNIANKSLPNDSGIYDRVGI
jgi:hypothetical protein